MSKAKIDLETGELLPSELTVEIDNAPKVQLDISLVAQYHTNPKGLAELIKQQCGFVVFDVSNEKGRKALNSHVAKIIRCISPAETESKRLASEAKKIVNQDVTFRRIFDEEVRAIAAAERLPLTEWEDDQARIEEIKRIDTQKRLEREQYLADWNDAIAFNELFDLKKKMAEIEAEKQRIQDEKDKADKELDIANKKAWCKENADGYQRLFPDMPYLLDKTVEEFKTIVLARVEKENKRIEQEKLIIAAEEQAKAEKAIQAEKDRLAREEQAKAIEAEREKEAQLHWEAVRDKIEEDEKDRLQVIKEETEKLNQQAEQINAVDLKPEPVKPIYVDDEFLPEITVDVCEQAILEIMGWRGCDKAESIAIFVRAVELYKQNIITI